MVGYLGYTKEASKPYRVRTLRPSFEHYSRLQTPNISRREARRESKQGELWGSTPSQVVTHYE
jgi:hypothetical protein